MNRKKLIRQSKNARSLVSQWSVRYPGHPKDPKALVESAVRGIGIMNGLSEVARGQIRFTSAQEMGVTQCVTKWCSHTVIRFEVGETAAAELQRVIGRRGGNISIGATSARLQHNRRDITAKTKISLHLQSWRRLVSGASTGLQCSFQKMLSSIAT